MAVKVGHYKALRKSASLVFDILPTPFTEEPDCLGFGLRPTKVTTCFAEVKLSKLLKKASTTTTVFSPTPRIEARNNPLN